jgi:hypothetical protein
MSKARRHDGIVYSRTDGKVLWIRYRDRSGRYCSEYAQTEDWNEANRKLRERLQARDGNLLEVIRKATLRRAKVPYFRIYDVRSTYATRLSAGSVADEWVTQMLRQGDAQVFKKYSQMKLQMKRGSREAQPPR